MEIPYTGGKDEGFGYEETPKVKKKSKTESRRDSFQSTTIKKQDNKDQINPDKKSRKGSKSQMPADQAQLPFIKYKTKLCRHFTITNTCALGDACSFAHGPAELRKFDDPIPKNFPGLDYVGAVHSNYKTQICRNFELNGMCSFGNLCCFAHGAPELRQLTQPMPAIPPEVLIYGPPKMRLAQKAVEVLPSHQSQQPIFFN